MMMPARLTATVPIRTRSTLNVREHWAKRASRMKHERGAVAAYCRHWPPLFDECVTVELTRIAPRELDDDNLAGALKAVRDEIAVVLGLGSDRDPRVRWVYGQARGQRPGEYAVRIEVRP